MRTLSLQKLLSLGPIAVLAVTGMLFVSAKAAAKVRLPVSGGSAGAPAVEVQASPHVLKLEKVALAAFSPDGKTLMTVGDVDRQVHFWSTDNGEEVNRFGVAVTNAIFATASIRKE